MACPSFANKHLNLRRNKIMFLTSLNRKCKLGSHSQYLKVNYFLLKKLQEEDEPQMLNHSFQASLTLTTPTHRFAAPSIGESLNFLSGAFELAG